MRTSWRTVVLVSVLAVAALVPMACGSDDTTSSVASPTPEAASSVPTTIVPTVVPGTALDALRVGDFRGFLAAAAAAGLQRDLRDEGPFTVFVPNEDAFRSVTLSELRQNAEQLRDVLEYHIVPDQNIQLDEVQSGDTFTSDEGAPLTITIDGGVTRVNDATIVGAYAGGDWTIYVIDQVLFPPSGSPSPSS